MYARLSVAGDCFIVRRAHGAHLHPTTIPNRARRVDRGLTGTRRHGVEFIHIEDEAAEDVGFEGGDGKALLGGSARRGEAGDAFADDDEVVGVLHGVEWLGLVIARRRAGETGAMSRC